MNCTKPETDGMGEDPVIFRRFSVDEHGHDHDSTPKIPRDSHPLKCLHGVVEENVLTGCQSHFLLSTHAYYIVYIYICPRWTAD